MQIKYKRQSCFESQLREGEAPFHQVRDRRLQHGAALEGGGDTSSLLPFVLWPLLRVSLSPSALELMLCFLVYVLELVTLLHCIFIVELLMLLGIISKPMVHC